MMKHISTRSLLWCATALSTCTSSKDAQAQDSEYGARAEVIAPIAATNTEDATASGTTVDLRERIQTLEELSEAVIDAPGVLVSSVGGEGGFSGLMLRGSELGHTTVLLGVLPLNTPDTGPFDFSTVPIAAFDEFEVYRGGAPAWYNEGAIGGVVRLVPASADSTRAQATLGGGSFGLWEARGTASYASSQGLRPELFGHVRYRHATNDYAYEDDGQTGYEAGDNTGMQQENAELSAGDAFLHGGLDALGGRVSFVALGHLRDQGVPGPMAAPTTHVNRKLSRAILGLAYERSDLDSDGESKYRLQFALSGVHQINQVRDLYAELGTSKYVDSNDLWRRGSLRVGASYRLLPFLEPIIVLSGTADAYDPENNVAISLPTRPSNRYTGAATLETRLFGRIWGMRAELRPSVRLVSAKTSITTTANRQVSTESLNDFFQTWRVAAALEPVANLTLATSFATGLRLPSISELFGDRVYQEPNTDLKPERSTTVDVSATWRSRLGALRNTLEVRGYHLDIEDLIRFQRTAQYTVRPGNVATASVLGSEVGLNSTYERYAELTAVVNVMTTENFNGKALPFRRPLSVLVRPTGHIFYTAQDRISLFSQLEHQSYYHTSDSNLAPAPARTLLSAGVSVTMFSELVQVSGRLDNITNAYQFDYLSRLLPRRAFKLSVSVQTEKLYN